MGDFLTDKKVPFETRDSLKLLCDGNDVLVVLGVEISNKIKVETTTKHIVKIRKAQ
ncbi:MAG: tRNA lysidine(34) synthetase TilS C-terminal domain-containing protein [Clostridia bacterium]